jgi:hypothetical protein
MRLTKQLRQYAIAELTEILKSNPQGFRVVDLVGTRHFHGVRTLSPRQIYSCLKTIPGIRYRYASGDMYAQCFWHVEQVVQ